MAETAAIKNVKARRRALRAVPHGRSGLPVVPQLDNSFALARQVPPAIAVVKKLSNPLIVGGTLLVLFGSAAPLSESTISLIVIATILARYLLPAQALFITKSNVLRDLLLLLACWSLVFVAIFLVALALGLHRVPPVTATVLWAVATPALLFVSHLGVRYWLGQKAKAAAAANAAVVVGVTPAGRALAATMYRTPFAGCRFAGFFDDRPAQRTGVVSDLVLGSLTDVLPFVRENSVSAVYITLPWVAQPRVAALVDALKDTTVSIYLALDVSEFGLFNPRFFQVGDVSGVSVCDSPFRGADGLTKRAFDVVLASAALLLLWPVMLVIALAVKCSSPGPAIFKQRRYGIDGEDITVLKFRTMSTLEAGAVARQATRNDARVTKVGAFLRRTSLDELPQLINVLQGSMSLVGPRPHPIALNEQYRSLVKGYMVRHKAKPGITGWAQVNGFRGETESVDKMSARVACDIDYLRHWSVWLDFIILMKTLILVFSDENAY